jgi:hypothetical protein
MARVLNHARRGRMVTARVVVAGAATAVVMVIVALRALPLRPDVAPAIPGVPTPSESVWPVPAPCLTGEPYAHGECGWLFRADLDGDGETDQVALIVSLGNDGYDPRTAELRARLASGAESRIPVEVNQWAGFPQVLPDTYVHGDRPTDPGVFDVDGDGSDEILLSLFQSAAGRSFIRLFVWESGGLLEVSAAGESPDSPRRQAHGYGDEARSGIESFEFIVGGSAEFGGGLRCANVDGDPQRELILRFYRYTRDPDFYEATEVVYDLEGAQATERISQTTRVPTGTVDDTFRGVSCGG